MSEASVRDVMPAPPRPSVEAVAGPAFELLFGLFAATSPNDLHVESWVSPPDAWSPELRAAIEAAGERSSEAWLHLLGLALELEAESALSFVEQVSRVPPAELRRHLVGVYVPAWTYLLGEETLERVAAGDETAVAEALQHPRYYAGRAREALPALLAVPAKETRRLVVDALRLFAEEVFAPHEEAVTALVRAGAEETRSLAGSLDPRAVIERVTRGYLYEPEREFDRVVLVPHVAAGPLLLLCQHRDLRVICHPLSPEQLDPEASLVERATALGRALGDERRVEILRTLASGAVTLDELAEAAGLARSTAHHHLARLRAAGLVTLGGNARGYWYGLRAEGLADAQRVLGQLTHAPLSGRAPPKRRTKRRSAGRPPRR